MKKLSKVCPFQKEPNHFETKGFSSGCIYKVPKRE